MYYEQAVSSSYRNFTILNAYLYGYSQIDIASHLKLSISLISKVVKNGDSCTVVNGFIILDGNLYCLELETDIKQEKKPYIALILVKI